MHFPDGLLSDAVLWLGAALYLPVLLLALRHAPWRRLRHSAEALHVFLGSCVALMSLWAIHVGAVPALNYHVLGVTTVTLMLGWPLAVLAVTAALIGMLLNGDGGLLALPANGLLMGLLPVLLTQWLLRLTQRHLPHNFFIYVFINAFLAAGLAAVAAALGTAGMILASGLHSLDWLSYHYLPYLPLMFFSEAVINGMITTMMVALRPRWVASFDDALYIDNK